MLGIERFGLGLALGAALAAMPLVIVSVACLLVTVAAIASPATRQVHLLAVLDRLVTFAAVLRGQRAGEQQIPMEGRLPYDPYR